jgi:hypothetical protein
MNEATRRGFLLGVASVGATLYAGPARATLVRGLPLLVLVQRSERILVVEPLEAVCGYAEIGGRRSIITDTRLRVHEAWTEAAESELLLRTLGGRMDGVAELVHGQPELELGVRGVAFLKLGRDQQAWWTVGMAQGHFPLSGASQASRLLANRNLPSILNLETSAVRRLVGRQLSEARDLVQKLRLP